MKRGKTYSYFEVYRTWFLVPGLVHDHAPRTLRDHVQQLPSTAVSVSIIYLGIPVISCVRALVSDGRQARVYYLRSSNFEATTATVVLCVVEKHAWYAVVPGTKYRCVVGWKIWWCSTKKCSSMILRSKSNFIWFLYPHTHHLRKTPTLTHSSECVCGGERKIVGKREKRDDPAQLRINRFIVCFIVRTQSAGTAVLLYHSRAGRAATARYAFVFWTQKNLPGIGTSNI